MNESFIFHPPRQRGLLFLGGTALFFGATSAISFLAGLHQTSSGYFIGLLLISLLLFAPFLFLLYRLYSLLRASYRLERDGLRLRWGLRAEDIPLPEIEWVRKASDMATQIPLPRLVWPGSLRGTVHIRDFGSLEYMASSRTSLVLIATRQKIFAISPEDPDRFLHAFQRTLEMGSLTPIVPASLLPAAYLIQIWRDRLARWIVTGGLLSALILLAGVGLVIPMRASVPLGFYPDGTPLPSVPSEQLILLPILGIFVYIIDLFIGLYLYRHEQHRLVAYMIWASALLTGLLFLIGLIILAQAGI